MSDELDILPSDIQAMLRAERSGVTAPDDGRARLAQRLAAAVPAFGPLPVPPSAPPPAAPIDPVLRLWKVGALKGGAAKAILALALGGGAGAAFATARDARSLRPATQADTQQDTRQAEPTAHPGFTAPKAPLGVPLGTETSAAAPLVAAPAPIASESTAPRGAVDARRASTPALGASVAARKAPPLSSPASLREEHLLLDAARDAIVQGEPDSALAPLATHAARFPQGVLAEEREALRIRALARLGRNAEAQAVLAAMRANYPHSFLLEGAASDIETIP